MKYNLQFFAENGVTEEVADLTEEIDYTEPPEDPEETEEVPEEPEETPQEPEEKPVQSPEENARYAAARREERARREAVEAEKARLDAQFAAQFGNYTNPITGEPIRSAQDYFDALTAQRQMAEANKQMQEQGTITPELINQMVESSPLGRQVQQVLAHQQEMEQFQMIDNELAIIHEIDPSITTASDLANVENFAEIESYWKRGYTISDAFKLANFGKVSKQSIDAVKQSAINQAKSKSHLTSTQSVTDEAGKELVDIPQDELRYWKECYPDLSMKELKAKYNSTL